MTHCESVINRETCFKWEFGSCLGGGVACVGGSHAYEDQRLKPAAAVVVF